jgi:L-seryl-tRNA(Ser) seleniumtransferase
MTVLLKAAESYHGLRAESRVVVTEALREVLDAIRTEAATDARIETILERARSLIQSRGATRLVRVINATGIVLHTGLGRSVLADATIQRITEAAGYCNLEIDLDSGKRGQRGQYAEQILCRLTGAEAALIVNNNAAATMLVLHGLAKGREVIVSRGQLIEIGGSYRLPEVMSAGGAILREVGTTNKTHLSDYEKAITAATAMLMHVHTSNYRVVGFTENPGVPDLVELAHRHNIPMFDDLGSGALLDDEIWKCANEPTATDSLRSGADVVAFSGDKLLGGPQAGILLGKKSIIERLRKDPMTRALRIGKLTAAALEATLELYQTPAEARQRIPILASLLEGIDALTARATRLGEALRQQLPSESFEVRRDESFAGGGSLPAWPMPTAVVEWRPGTSLDALAHRLRMGRPAVLPRISEGAMLFDVRTIAECEITELAGAVSAAAAARDDHA